MVIDGKQSRYTGAMPRSLNPFATVNLGTAMLELAKMCKTIPLAPSTPDSARRPRSWSASG